MKGVVDRIGQLFHGGWQWLAAAPRYCGALLSGLSVLGAMIAIGYNGSKGILAPFAPETQTSDVVAARLSAMSGGSGATKAENSLPKDIVDAEAVQPSAANNESRSPKGGPSERAIAADKSFLVADAEKQTAAIRDKGAVKKAANKPKKTTQRRDSTDKDRKFNPSREVKRVGETITRVIRDIF